MSKARIALGATLLAALVAVHGQTPGDARLRLDPVPTHAVRGLSAEETRGFQLQVRRVVESVAANPAIGRPPAPVCTALHPWIEQGLSDDGVAMAQVLIALPTAKRDGSCNHAANTSIEVWINRLKPLFNCIDPIGDETFCTLAALQPGPHGFQVHRGPKKIYYVWQRGSEPLMQPVTREQYLRARDRQWTRQAREAREQYDRLAPQYRTDDSGVRQLEGLVQAVRAELDALPAADRAQPACMPNLNSKVDAKTPFWTYGRQCEPGFMLGRPNAALFRSGSRAGIQVLVLETLSGRTGAVEPYLHDYKLKLLSEFDFAALARTLAAPGNQPSRMPPPAAKNRPVPQRVPGQAAEAGMRKRSRPSLPWRPAAMRGRGWASC
jgi:hypothetical protein